MSGGGGFWLPDAAQLAALTPEFTLTATIVAILGVTILIGRRPRLTASLALGGALVALWTAIASIPVDHPHADPFLVPDAAQRSAMLTLDATGAAFRAMVAGMLTAVIGVAMLLEHRWRDRAAEFMALLLATAVGAMFMATSANLLLMILAIELVSMPSYALAGFDRTRRSAEAAAKYVIFGAMCTGIGAFGASLLFGLCGTLHLPTIVAQAASGDHLLSAAALLLVAGVVLFKIASAPLHFWCPDVFDGAPLSVAMWLSFASKGAGIVLLLRITGWALPSASGATRLVELIALLSIATMCLANLAAYRQTSVRRLLAYSSIAHAGTMLAACAAAVGLAEDAASAVLQYLFVYLLMTVGAFGALAVVARATRRETLDAFAGLGWRDPLLAAALTAVLLSLIGLPPLGGFVAKFWVIAALAAAAATSTASVALWLAVAAIVINTAISLFYYAGVIRQMWFIRPGAAEWRGDTPVAARVALAICALALAYFGTVGVAPLKHRADAIASAGADPQPPRGDAKRQQRDGYTDGGVIRPAQAHADL